MFLDASAIVAILAREPDADGLLAQLDAAEGNLFYSGISAFEAVVSLARRITNVSQGEQSPVPGEVFDHAQETVYAFLADLEAAEIEITESVSKTAISACRTYGKLVAHPARLNLGDCFAYACAKTHRLPLLYKGNDFSQTDIAAAA